ncbi:hypothetical protein [Pseudonocardia thermophila]|uniref:hypothetical protein n=1 Tax=Pseudonocardia thermophila TaxID=1848 RepID=UPI00248F1DEE|nr:hypothetical protein [Pseudonocardia thermophila]
MSGGPTYESTHQLLLGLAGHIDDDLLAWVRELAAVGEEARAVSLATAGIAAGRIPLPGPVRAALIEAGHAARVGIDPAELAPAAELPVAHRFTASVPGAPDVASAVRALPPRQLQGTTVHLTWRLTPAGTAPGPLPHPVVIVEIDPARHSGEMLSYLMASGLTRSGVHASVEVITAGQPLPAYHEAALAAAVPVLHGANGPGAGGPGVEPGAVTEPVRIVRPFDEPEPAEEPAAEPLGEVAAAEPLGEVAAPDEPTEESTEPAPGEPSAAEPAVEPEPILDPGEPHPFADVPLPPPPPRPPAAGAALSALSDPIPEPDPLSDPLSEPLLAPLLDPTIREDDPLGVDHLVSRSPAADEAPAEQPAAESAPATGAGPVETAENVLIEDSWAAEWESGAWAMPLDELRPEPDREPPADPSRPGLTEQVTPPQPQRHGFTQEVPPPAPPPEPRQARTQVPPPASRPEPPAPRRGEPTRLSDADRELLARLQAELVQGRKPRRPGAPATGRPGANGRGPNRPERPPEAR